MTPELQKMLDDANGNVALVLSESQLRLAAAIDKAVERFTPDARRRCIEALERLIAVTGCQSTPDDFTPVGDKHAVREGDYSQVTPPFGPDDFGGSDYGTPEQDAALIEEQARREKPTLPTFDELQEGDWVDFAPPDNAPPVIRHARGYVARGGCDPIWLVGTTAVPSHWKLVAFKPLRQVVEEMAQKLIGAVEFDWSGFAFSVTATDPDRNFLGEMAIFAPDDERTALLAAKVALEVMIARRGAK